MFRTEPISFPCAGHKLYGLLATPAEASARGVLILVGGPQYRVGSHRQFVLLARHLAAAGYPVLRFDHRGIGDSGGEPVSFEDLEPDIRSAIDTMQGELPDVSEVVIWGLCDAASAALMYAPGDSRVAGVVLLNPWVRSEQSLARAYFGSYYMTQILSPDFWKRLFTGKVKVWESAQSLASNTRDAVRPAGRRDRVAAAKPYQDRMEDALRQYQGQVLVILSGDDITATEFRELVAGSRGWQRSLNRAHIRQHAIAEANHTFSRGEWRDRVADWTLDWLRSW